MLIPRNNKSFTLLEVIIVFILIGVIATSALIRFRSIIEENYERITAMDLESIKSAMLVYQKKHGQYPIGNLVNTSAINTTLGLKLSTSGVSFNCLGNALGSDYDCIAINAAYGWGLHVSPLVSSFNVHCFWGPCPTCDGGDCPFF